MIPFTERGAKFVSANTLSAVFMHALQDVRACERAGNYVRHDLAPHVPNGTSTLYTLTGAVLAITFGANRKKRLYSHDLHDVNLERRLNAVTALSEGAVTTAASSLARSDSDFSAGSCWGMACAMHEKHGNYAGRRIPYFADASAWDEWARSFLRELQGVGL